MSLAMMDLASHPPAGWEGRAAPFWAAAAVIEYGPYLQQSPPFRACLVHPSLLQHLVLMPCVTHTPPDDSVGAPIVAATFLLCAVRDANTPLDGSIDTPLVAASFLSRAMRGATPPLTAPLAHPSWLQRLVRA